MSREEELQMSNVAELVTICKANGIPHYRGKTRFKKDELVEAILRAEVAENSNEDNSKSATDKCAIDNHGNVEVGVKQEKEPTGVTVDMKQKMPYIETAEIGTIVAFKLPSGKVKSAKIVKRSTSRRCLMLETDYGATYVAGYDDIFWVRTGRRWPRGIYNLLKGTVTYGKGKAD